MIMYFTFHYTGSELPCQFRCGPIVVAGAVGTVTDMGGPMVSALPNRDVTLVTLH